MRPQLPDHVRRYLDSCEVHDLAHGESVRGASGQVYQCHTHGRRYYQRTNTIAWYAFLTFCLGVGVVAVVEPNPSSEHAPVLTWLNATGYALALLGVACMLGVFVWRMRTTRHIWLDVDDSADPDAALGRFGATVSDARGWELGFWPVHEAWIVLRKRPSTAALSDARRAGLRCFISEHDVVVALDAT